MRGRERDTEPRRGLPERHPSLDRLAYRKASCRSELRSTVNLHSGLIRGGEPSQAHSLGRDRFCL
jgi:hypothetical protein